jgi:methyl coenzyme M reductase subunit C-like uncharacterized protein (methanogenesis marker protein 7)
LKLRHSGLGHRMQGLARGIGNEMDMEWSTHNFTPLLSTTSP